jgi:hypothetical protein
MRRLTLVVLVAVLASCRDTPLEAIGERSAVVR